MFKRLTALYRPALLLCSLATLAVPPSRASVPLRQQIDVTNYVIHAEIDPATNHLSATVNVSFQTLDDLSVIIFGLNNGLQVTKVTDGQGRTITSERVAADSTLRINPITPIAKNTSTAFTITYSGVLTLDTSPVDGIKLAAIADPISILLYAGRWFPISMPGLFTDRFTAETHITVPAGEKVIGSGFTGQKTVGKTTEYSFNWTRSGFPGTIVAGKFLDPVTAPGIPNIRVFTTEAHKAQAHDFANTVVKEFEFFSSTFGPAETGKLDVVELPGDAVSAAWGPEVIAIRPDRGNARLFANTIAHQWWGNQVSPATLNDAWITNGMSRYAELLYLEDSAGKGAFQTAVTDISAGALAYDTDPLTTIGRLDPFSPQFQSETLEKGAMVFHMLRWEMGDDAFLAFLRGMLSQYTDKPIRSANVQTVAEAQSHLELTAFFSQWVNGTGAPAFADKYTVFRLGSNKGFRTVGAVTQDLDLFKMPVELRIETEGKTEDRRVDLSGNESQFTVETFGRPRRITIDPDNWLLKSTPDLAVRVAVLRGQQQVAQGDLIAAIGEYQKALDANKQSSLANYRLGEIFLLQKNYQSAANTFRDALRGDGDPRWTAVWSHIELGRIFDCTGQRERAVNEYRLAVQTNDNTQGAVNEARSDMQKPYVCGKSVD
ncbi:MAG: M1 family aminopeptidase [Acidobacteriaceae bacterium]